MKDVRFPPSRQAGARCGRQCLWVGAPLATNRTPGDGTRNWFKITGNVPGLRDAGRIWMKDCDDFLLVEGFVQSIVDRRMFIK